MGLSNILDAVTCSHRVGRGWHVHVKRLRRRQHRLAARRWLRAAWQNNEICESGRGEPAGRSRPAPGTPWRSQPCRRWLFDHVGTFMEDVQVKLSATARSRRRRFAKVLRNTMPLVRPSDDGRPGLFIDDGGQLRHRSTGTPDQWSSQLLLQEVYPRRARRAGDLAEWRRLTCPCPICGAVHAI